MANRIENKVFETVQKKVVRSMLNEEDIRQCILEPDGELSEMEFSDDEEDVVYFEDRVTKFKSNLRKVENQKSSCPNIEESNAEEIELIETREAASHNTIQYRWRTRSFQPPANIEWKSSLPDPPLDILRPISYFKMFFDDNMIETLVYHTNLYAMQTSGTILAVSKKEMQQFIGINMLMGIVKMPSVYGYWELATRFPPIADIMSRDRFKTLRRYFHGNDNTTFVEKGNDDYDPLFKFRPTLDALRANLLKIPQEEHQSIDEQMIPFKGFLHFKQYLKDKPHSWGIKVFCRAGSSGIVYDIEIYTGKNKKQSSEMGQAADVVLRLLENVPRHLNHKVFFDNYYTGLPLIQKLTTLGIYSIGTVRPNRLKGCVLKCDGALKKMGRGSLDTKVDIVNNIVVTKWHDNKAVYLASSFAGPDPTDVCKRWDKKVKKYDEITRPYCIAQYNKFMGGVDLCDMLMELYRINNRGKKWYMRVFYYFFDLCVVNGWLLYRRHLKQTDPSTSYMTLLEFKSDIANYLTSVCGSSVKPRGRRSKEITIKKRKVAPKPYDSLRFDKTNHWPEAVRKKKRCRQCSAYARIQCKKCRIPLCLTPDRNCFEIFHSG